MTYIGTSFPIQLKSNLRRSQDGWVREDHWKVTTAAVNSFVDLLTASGYTEIDATGIEGTPFHAVSAQASLLSGPTDILADVWSVDYNEFDREIWKLPIIKAQFVAATTDEAVQFRADVESYLSGDRVYTDSSGSEQTLTADGLTSRALGWGADASVIALLFASLQEGSDTQLVSLPVLRRRITLPQTTTLAPTFIYINQVFTTESLLAFETTIPSNLSGEIATRFAGGYWLRKAPKADQQDDGRWIYSAEYWYAETAAPNPLLYPEVI